MLDTIEKLLPSKSARLAMLLVILLGGGIWLGVKGKDYISAYAKEEATVQTKLIINDEIREAAKEAATDAAVSAARKAAREAAKETAEEMRSDRDVVDRKFAEQEARIKKLEKAIKDK